MQSPIEIKHLSRQQKLMVMEAIWENLQHDAEPLQSPDWHKKALKETESRYCAGKEKILDWKDAKKELRKGFE